MIVKPLPESIGHHVLHLDVVYGRIDTGPLTEDQQASAGS